MSNAVTDDDIESYIESVNDIVATSYAFFIFDDLYRHIDYLFHSIDSTVNTPSADAQGKTCDTRVFAPAIAQFEKLYENLKVNRRHLAVSMKQKMDAFEATANIKMISQMDGDNLKIRQWLGLSPNRAGAE